MYTGFIARLAPWFSLILLIPVSFAVGPQQFSTTNSTIVIKTDVREVLIPVVARDSRGQIVENLAREDFQVLDDGKPQVITAFQVVKHASDAATSSTPLPSAVNRTHIATQPASPTQRFVVFLF